MRLVAGSETRQVTYEVWREFNGQHAHEDAIWAGGMTARESLVCLRECRRDTADLPMLRFYRVRCETTRQRVDE